MYCAWKYLSGSKAGFGTVEGKASGPRCGVSVDFRMQSNNTFAVSNSASPYDDGMRLCATIDALTPKQFKPPDFTIESQDMRQHAELARWYMTRM